MATTQVPSSLLSSIPVASAATALAGTDNAAALTAAALSGNASIGSNGYYKLPGGLIIQWGSVSVAGSSQSTVTFPVAFTTAVYSVSVSYNDTPNGGASMAGVPCGVGTLTTTNMSVGNGAGATHTIGWIAIGK